MTALNLSEVREWLEIVYGDTPGLINICSTADWAGKIYGNDQIDFALHYIQSLDRQGVEGIYARATTLRQAPQAGQRGGDDLSFYLPGLWADIDIAGPGHKTKNTLPPDVDAAIAIVNMSGLPEPSHWIHSGGGLYPWWLLKDAAEITDLEGFRNLSAAWQQALVAGAQKLGYHYGSGVGDLSRVLRIPGTVNRKAGMSRPCTALVIPGQGGYAWGGPRYTLDELIDAAIAVAPEPEAPKPAVVKPGSRFEGEKPGEEFNRTASWHDILEPHGWSWVRKMGDSWYLRRPGKTHGTHSATLRTSTDCLYVFSEEAYPFEVNKPYSKFGALAVLEHGGDFGAAAKFLASRGYGTQRTPMVAASPVPTAPASPVPTVVEAPTAQRTMDQGPAPQVLRRRDKEGIPIFDSEFFDTFEWDNDISITVAFAQAHADTLKSLHKDKAWMFWDGTRWCPDGHGRHELAAGRFIAAMMDYAKAVNRIDPVGGKEKMKVATRLSNLSRGASALARASMPQPELATAYQDYDQDGDLMTVDNGILNLKTMELTPHDPSKLLTKKVNAKYVPGATTGRFTRFVEEVLPDPAVRDYFQRAMGYAMTGEADQRAIFLLHGESGTGKTQTLEAIATVLGDFATTAAGSAFRPRQEGYKGPSEDLHQLKGKRFVIQSELDQGAMLNEGLIKAITGADTQNTRDLYQSSQTWRPEYVVFLATNYLPRVSSSDNAIWKRFKPIKFEQVFIDEAGMPKDPGAANLGRKMAISEPEVILNWLLEGLRKYRQHGLAAPGQIDSWLTSYRDETDTVRQFILEGGEEGTVVIAEGLDAGARELYNTYNAWCLNNHIRPLGSTNFRQRMESSGWKRGRTAKGQRWMGLGLTGFIREAQTPASGRGNWYQRE